MVGRLQMNWSVRSHASLRLRTMGGIINTNKPGIPTKPYAFLNNYKPIIRAPEFGDCKFAYTGNNDTLVISLINGIIH
jgi:uncharacterized protein (DUF2141 family)